VAKPEGNNYLEDLDTVGYFIGSLGSRVREHAMGFFFFLPQDRARGRLL